nr:hypothetical protein [Pseudomonas sp. BIGb0427]
MHGSSQRESAAGNDLIVMVGVPNEGFGLHSLERQGRDRYGKSPGLYGKISQAGHDLALPHKRYYQGRRLRPPKQMGPSPARF